MKRSDTQDETNVISFDQARKERELKNQDDKVEITLDTFNKNLRKTENKIEGAMFGFINHFQNDIMIPEDKEQEKIDGLMWALNQVLRSIYYYIEGIEYPLQDEVWDAWEMILGEDEFLERQGNLF